MEKYDECCHVPEGLCEGCEREQLKAEVSALRAQRDELRKTLEYVTDTLRALAPYPPDVAEGVVFIVGMARECLEKAREP